MTKTILRNTLIGKNIFKKRPCNCKGWLCTGCTEKFGCGC